MAKILSGTEFLEAEKARLRDRIMRLNRAPGLGTILVGADPNSQSYIRHKHQACADVGIVSHHVELAESSTQQEVIAAIEAMNNDEDVDAFIVQLPLPQQCNEEQALLAIDPVKDADGLHPVNLGKLVMGVDAPRPCTPLGIQALLKDNGIDLTGKHVVIVGRGLTIGRPLANLLTLKEAGANATVTVVHTGTPDIAQYTRDADVVIAAVGVPDVITPDMVKDGVVLVSAGMTFGEGRRLIPDISEGCADKASFITPRIGGVGPTTIAMLLRNTVTAAEKANR
ncbi:MAG TPA: tetrahydrofolate dehydrogenase/cyclohydrolase catalytic domain-containing protein [Acidimicrobiia bacterium]|nr:tetrahydrofolate dehydrogenase/cyclohydrolase catalytic domain-containing protein [Acidimicrobiia bacterium]